MVSYLIQSQSRTICDKSTHEIQSNADGIMPQYTSFKRTGHAGDCACLHPMAAKMLVDKPKLMDRTAIDNRPTIMTGLRPHVSVIYPQG